MRNETNKEEKLKQIILIISVFTMLNTSGMQRDYMQEHTDFIDYRLGNVHEDLRNENKILLDEIRLLREQLQNSEAQRQEQQRQLAELSRQQKQIKQQEAERLRVEKERLAEQQRLADYTKQKEIDFSRMEQLKGWIIRPFTHNDYKDIWTYNFDGIKTTAIFCDDRRLSFIRSKARDWCNELQRLNKKYGLPELPYYLKNISY